MARKIALLVYRHAFVALIVWLSCCPKPTDFGSWARSATCRSGSRLVGALSLGARRAMHFEFRGITERTLDW